MLREHHGTYRDEFTERLAARALLSATVNEVELHPFSPIPEPQHLAVGALPSRPQAQERMPEARALARKSATGARRDGGTTVLSHTGRPTPRGNATPVRRASCATGLQQGKSRRSADTPVPLIARPYT